MAASAHGLQTSPGVCTSDVKLTFGTGLFFEINWTPVCRLHALLIESEKSGRDVFRISAIDTTKSGGFLPPVRYGFAPARARVRGPLGQVTPDSSIKVSVWRQSGSTMRDYFLANVTHRGPDTLTQKLSGALIQSLTQKANSAAARSNASPPPAPRVPGLRTPPEKIGAYIRTTSQNLGADAGVVHRYSGGSVASVNVYVYPIPADVKQNTTDTWAWTVREGEKFKEVLALMKTQRTVQDYSMMQERRDSSVAFGMTVTPAHFVTATTTRNGATGVEMVFLYYIRGAFMKVRATVSPENYKTSDVTDFAVALATAMFY